MMKKVMIIDDDREFLGELSTLLMLSGYEVIALEEPALSRTATLAANPDVILLDLKMETLSGFDVLDQLRSSPATRAIPVIVTSGFFSEERDFPLLNFFSVKNYLRKPFSPLSLITQIEAAAKNREPQNRFDERNA